MYILYKGEARANCTGPRRIKSFARRSRYFITFLVFRKTCSRARPAPVESGRIHRACTRFLFTCASRAPPPHVHYISALHYAPAHSRLSTERGEFVKRRCSTSRGEERNQVVPSRCNRTPLLVDDPRSSNISRALVVQDVKFNDRSDVPC